jgi:hypothetical protein
VSSLRLSGADERFLRPVLPILGTPPASYFWPDYGGQSSSHLPPKTGERLQNGNDIGDDSHCGN